MRKLNFIEATCLIAGAGIGGGFMGVPYLAQNIGFLYAVLIAVVAYVVTLFLHIMVAELSVRTDYSSELLTVFSKHLFQNKKLLRFGFYMLMTITLICNLAAYITGSGVILSQLIGIPLVLGKIMFFILAAAVVFFGLKKIAINEVIALAVMVIFLTVMTILSFLKPAHILFKFPSHNPAQMLAVYGMIMFSLSSLFAVPQAASGLRHSRIKLVWAIVLGLFINLMMTIIIIACVLVCSQPVTEVAIVGWAEALGPAVNVIGSLFVFLAMLGTFWSISLQLCDMTGSFFKTGHRMSWLVATLPSIIIALLPVSGFLNLMQIAGGATAVIVALMVVPAYRNSICSIPQRDILLGSMGKSRIVAGIVMLMYILMAVASCI